MPWAFKSSKEFAGQFGEYLAESQESAFAAEMMSSISDTLSFVRTMDDPRKGFGGTRSCDVEKGRWCYPLAYDHLLVCKIHYETRHIDLISITRRIKTFSFS